MSNIPLLKSKKASMALACAVLSFLCVKSGFTTEQTALVVGPLMAYIPIEGAIDHRRAKNPAPVAEGK